MKYKIKFHCKQPLQTRIECVWQRLITYDWHFSVDFGALRFSVVVWQLVIGDWHLPLCPVPVNLLSTFGIVSSTKSAVSRKIFIFNCTLGATSFKLVVHVEEPRLLPNSSQSRMKMCLKYLNHFSNTTRFSN